MRILSGKILCFLLVGVLLSAILPACTPPLHKEDGVQIVATTFPAYDIARTLTKDCRNVRVRLLLSPGTESHTYDPSAADMMAVHDADLLMYIGQDADAWVNSMLQSAGKKVRKFVLTEDLELIQNEHGEADPHVWTNPANVIQIVERLTPVLSTLPGVFGEDATAIEVNAAAYIQKLELLDNDFRAFWAGVPEADRLLVFGDRFPFVYFAKAYGVSYSAAFPGCSHESEPSASAVMSLIDTVRNRSISTVFYVEFSQHRIADSIAAETGAKTALLHACHNVTKEEFDAGETYLSLMQQNLQQLQESFR
ncbi:MAG: zinc ABC transporter substrate-binding protein [Clostridia bacterium]|nr:zinc ABC transporter substrate-binding protein [Clostridia bacterium]